MSELDQRIELGLDLKGTVMELKWNIESVNCRLQVCSLIYKVRSDEISVIIDLQLGDNVLGSVRLSVRPSVRLSVTTLPAD